MTTPKTEALLSALQHRADFYARWVRTAMRDNPLDTESPKIHAETSALFEQAVTLLTSEREASQRREAVLREALEKVAHQETTSEMESTNLNYEGDFEDAYDTIIGIARAALNNGDAG